MKGVCLPGNHLLISRMSSLFQAKEVEETIEGMLLRLEEFCSLADLVSGFLGGMNLGPGQTSGPSWSFGVFWGSHFGGELATRRNGAAASAERKTTCKHSLLSLSLSLNPKCFLRRPS